MSTPVSKEVWDVALAHHYRQGGSFRLQLDFRSSARRLALVGPSGVGKSLTLRLLAGLERPQAGRIALQGEPLFDAARGLNRPARSRGIGLVFQDYALFPHLTVRQNVAFGLRQGWRNPGRDCADGEVERWLEVFALQATAGRFPDQLSGGQRQRVALARALVARPRALLLDEPLAALDRALQRRLRDELADLQHLLDLPLVVVTHDEDDVHALADEVLELHEGSVRRQRRTVAGRRDWSFHGTFAANAAQDEGAHGDPAD